jgi:TATA-binding protein-associated factor
VLEDLAQRKQVLQQIADGVSDYDLVIMNYEKVSGSAEMLSNCEFFFLVLDEAHKIKNAKAKLTQAIKKLTAERKLVLSGTPLQNRVSELWSLFDFIMPDFLEEESVFNKMYNKYLTANIKKMQDKLDET